MIYTLSKLIWIFFIYSFIGWILEISFAAVTKKKFLNRGILNGPLCTIYGFAAIIIETNLQELKYNLVFLFLGCTIVSTFIEWITGRLLEKFNHSKWWDYSNKKWNLDGYICLQYSILWGISGVISIKYLNPILVNLYSIIPQTIRYIGILTLLVILIIDAIGSYTVIFNFHLKIRQITKVNNSLTTLTLKLSNFITGHITKRIEKAYPTFQTNKVKKVKSTTFAKGCSFYKLIMLFFIGAFLGDIIETIFCRLTVGVWMSRSSVVWGPFSIVWGLAITIATLLLYNYLNKSDSFIFLFGTFLGGAYEYICSVFTEKVFGTVFWDYSKIKFNLGGRINLLFCFFWGIAAVVWLKKLYPPTSKYIEKIPMKIGKFAAWSLIIFMLIDMTVSILALTRYNDRSKGIAATNQIEQIIDKHFDNARMKQIYPNAIKK